MKIRKEDLKELYPLTRMQEGMLFHALREPESAVYTEQVVWRVRAPFDVACYQRAWDYVHQRYEALRSVFTHEKTRQPLQLVLKERAADFSWVDLRNLSTEEQDIRLTTFRRDERTRPFDLASGPLLRVRGHQLAIDQCEICVTWHHILLDGWSTHQMFQDLFVAYSAFTHGEEPQLAPLPPYAPYIEWLERQDIAASMAWWKGLLNDYEGIAEIPRGGMTSPVRHLEKLDFRLNAGGVQALKSLAQRLNTTASSVLQTVWGMLLGRYADSNDVVFGAVVSGRSPEVQEIERLPGLLINTIPVRVRFAVDDTFVELLTRVHHQALEAQAHHACRLAAIQNDTEQRADLIKHVLVFENYPVGSGPSDHGGPSGLQVVETSEPTSYDLLIVVDPSSGLRIEFQYNAAIYDAALVEQISRHFEHLLLAVLETPDARLAELDILSDDERRYLINDLNATGRDYPRGGHLAEVFATVVVRHAQCTALVHAGGRLSYSELDRRATRLAHFLARKGVGAGERVLVMLDRSPELIEAILAIVKLGAIYVPHNPDGPEERLHFVLADAGIRTAVLLAAAHARLDEVECVYPDADADLIEACPEQSLRRDSVTEEACLLYTSGTTGIPKGVQIPHNGILRLVCNADYLPLGPADRMAHLSNVTFDAANLEIWSALLNGSALYIIDRDTALQPGALASTIREQGLTAMFLTTALFNQMAREVPDAFATLTTLMTGGEAADGQWMKRVLERGAPKRLLNLYGPTEVSTVATCEAVSTVVPGKAVPIGRPISNTLAYVVDRELRLQAPYAAGELLLGGDGVALGYLNRPELNAERFVPDPFLGTGRLYRTGDIVRRLGDGRLEFLGRRDQQVKLRGFRIELGEIEAALRDFPQVDEALVVVRRETGDEPRRLIGYLGMSTPLTNADLELRRYLKKRLPDYMIPSAFVILDRLPLNANGKIDRRALPAPSRGGTGFGKAFVAPVGALEQQLAAIWASVLGVAQIGRNDSFFELGGHSLTASTALAHIRAALKVDVPLPFFFQCPNLEALAVEVGRLQQNAPLKSSGIARVPRTPVPAKAIDDE